MAHIPEHLLWLHERHGIDLSAALHHREGVDMTSGEAIAAFAKADPTPGLRLTDWLVRTYVEHASFRFEDVRAGLQSTVGTTLALFLANRGSLPPDARNINLYDSPGALWKAVGGDTPPKPSKREDRARARAESRMLIDDERGIVAVPLTEYASCWWGRGTRWCTAAREDNAFHTYAKNGPLFVLVLPDGTKSQFHVSVHQAMLMDAADNNMSGQSRKEFSQLLDPIVRSVVGRNGIAIAFGSRALQGERDVVYRAVQSKPDILNTTIRHFLDDEDVMQVAVATDPNMLRYASPRIKGSKRVVIEAVKRDGWVLGYAEDGLKDDWDTVFEAVKTSNRTLLHVSIRLRADRRMIM